jgi:hypothetical protein
VHLDTADGDDWLTGSSGAGQKPLDRPSDGLNLDATIGAPVAHGFGEMHDLLPFVGRENRVRGFVAAHAQSGVVQSSAEPPIF